LGGRTVPEEQPVTAEKGTGPHLHLESPPGSDAEATVQAFDHLGNPVCPGCWEGPLMWAARRNSGKGTCGCPAPDRRLPDLETRAEAIRLLRDVMDVLDEASPPRHSVMCVCVACRARRVVTRGW
jgi:hypothetical protein